MLRHYRRATAGELRECAEPFLDLLRNITLWDGNAARFVDRHTRSTLISQAGAAAGQGAADSQKKFNSICSMKNNEFFWWAERAILRVLGRFDAQGGDRQELQENPSIPNMDRRLIGIVESVCSQAWAECRPLYAWSPSAPGQVLNHVRSFVRKSLTEDERTGQSTDLAVVVRCFVDKLALDVAGAICAALRKGKTECSTDVLMIPKIMRHSRVGGLLKDTYKIWLVCSVKGDPRLQAARFIEADPGSLAYGRDTEQVMDLGELARVCAAAHEGLRPARLPVAAFFSAAFPEPGTPHLLVFEGPWLTKTVPVSPQEMKDMGWHGEGPGYTRLYASPVAGAGIPIVTGIEENVLGMYTPAGRVIPWAEAAGEVEDD